MIRYNYAIASDSLAFIVNQKVLPFPGSDSSHIFPPKRVTRPLTIDKTSLVPPKVRLGSLNLDETFKNLFTLIGMYSYACVEYIKYQLVIFD